jgi:HAD superfamily hydrolase (TIGR01509 family)
MSLKALIFDMDGTLADSDPMHLRAFSELLAPHGFNVDEAFFRSRLSGRTNDAIFADFFPDLPAEDQRRIADEKEAVFRRMATALEPLPGLMRLFDWAEERGIALALVTNAPAANVRHILKALDIDRRLAVQVLSEELARGKPDPLPYLTALDRLSAEPSDAVVFEDSTSGVVAAKGAGLFTFGLLTGQAEDILRGAGADLVIKDFDDPVLWRALSDRLSA